MRKVYRGARLDSTAGLANGRRKPAGESKTPMVAPHTHQPAYAGRSPRESLLRRQVIPLGVQLDAVQALARGDVEHVGTFAAAEADVRGHLRLDVADFLPFGRIHANAR